MLADYAEPEQAAARGDMIEMINQALRWVPWYPTETAIQLGFDREMPVIDGSTSTYPYTEARVRTRSSPTWDCTTPSSRRATPRATSPTSG